MLREDVRREVQAACERPGNVLTGSFYPEHLRLVAAYSTMLAPALGADPEVVELAAYLHDLSAVLDFATLPTHAAASAELARATLAERGYPDGRSEQVAAAIRRHGEPLSAGAGTPEEICLSNADAMAQIAAPAFWLYFAFRVRSLGYADGRDWYGRRVRQCWEAMVPEARALVGTEYARALELTTPMPA